MGSFGGLLRLGRPMKVLLAGVALFHAGWYLILPFFAVLFTSRRGLTATEAGLLLAVQSFTLLAGSLAGGVVADRWGRPRAMLAGLLLRGAGLGALGLFTGLPALALAMGAAGLGGGLFGPAAKAGIAALASAQERTTAFAARGIAANLGTTGGPVLGGLLMLGPMALLFGVAAGLHLALAGLTWALYREEGDPGRAAPQPVLAALADPPYLRFSLVTVLAWALFAQLAIAIPLYARAVLGLEASIGLLWTASSLTVIALQLAISRWAGAHLGAMAAMALGAVLLGAGLGLVALATSFGGLLAAVLLFIIGEMLLMPTADSAIAHFARPGALGAYFGVGTLVWGLGEGLGSLAGGALMQRSLTAGPLWLPWVLFAGVGLLLGGLYLALGRTAGQPVLGGPRAGP